MPHDYTKSLPAWLVIPAMAAGHKVLYQTADPDGPEITVICVAVDRSEWQPTIRQAIDEARGGVK